MMLTAQEARDVVNKSEVVSREMRSILRSVKRAARKGRYNLDISYSNWDSVVAERICENLRELGYRAYTDILRPIIYVSWKGEE